MEPSKQDREDFWLDLGPAAEWADMQPEAAAEANGDASPDGKRRGFSGAENGTVYEPSGEKAQNGKAEPPDAPGQTPDVSTGGLPPELPPIPPITWPGL